MMDSKQNLLLRLNQGVVAGDRGVAADYGWRRSISVWPENPGPGAATLPAAEVRAADVRVHTGTFAGRLSRLDGITNGTLPVGVQPRADAGNQQHHGPELARQAMQGWTGPARIMRG